MHQIHLKIWLFVALFGVSALSMNAQTRGSIKGAVTDEFGAVIPGAKVFLKIPSPDDGIKSFGETATDDNGEYFFSAVPFGIYEIHVKVKWFGREFTKRVELTSVQPTKLDISFNFKPCSDEQETRLTDKITESDRSEMVRVLVGLLIGHSKEKIVLLQENISPESLSLDQRSRTSILRRSSIQALAEKNANGELTYFSLSKPIQTGRCVSISFIYHVAIKGQSEDANMAGGSDNYEFRKVDGTWKWILLSSFIS